MYARVVTFRLDGPSHEEYESQATAIAASFDEWDGLLAKFWLADQPARTYGGIYLFASAEHADQTRSSYQFRTLEELPMFVDLRVDEYEVLDGPTAVTGGPFALVGAAS